MQAWLLRLTDNLVQSLETVEQALAFVRGETRTSTRARVLRIASVITDEAGQAERSRQLSEECLQLRRELGDEFGIAILLADLAMSELREGDVVAAKEHCQETLALLEGASSDATAATQHTFAVAALALDDVEAACRWLSESLSTYESLRDAQGVAACLELAAALVARIGRPRLSTVLAAAAAAVFERNKVSDSDLQPIRNLYESHLARAQAALKDDERSNAWQEGSSLATEEAVELALEALG